jgi:hypothetical protein
MYFVTSVSGVLHHESGNFSIKEGGAFFFREGKWYWVEGEELLIVVPTPPALHLE